MADFAPSPTQGRSGATSLPASRTRKWNTPSVPTRDACSVRHISVGELVDASHSRATAHCRRHTMSFHTGAVSVKIVDADVKILTST